jgi:PAS domain S-box-containing protein
MSIKYKLIIMFLAVGLIPLFLVSMLTFNNYKNSLEASRYAQLSNIIAFKKDKAETYFSELRTNIKIAQNSIAIKKYLSFLTGRYYDLDNPDFFAAKEDSAAQLQKIRMVLDLTDTMLVNSAGAVVFLSGPGDTVNGSVCPLSAFEQKAIRAGKGSIYVSDILSDKRFDQGKGIVVTAPVLDNNGSYIGAIVFEDDVVPIYKLIQETGSLGSTGEILICKKTGNQVFYLNPFRHEQDSVFRKIISIGDKNGFAAQEAVQGREGSGKFLDYRGVQVIGAWRYIPELEWGIVAKMDVQEAFAEITKLRHLVLIILVIMFLLAGITAISIAESIACPIQLLTKGAAIIGSGNLDHKVGTGSKDEIGQLSKEFDKMAEDLKTVTVSRDELNTQIEERKQAQEKLADERRNLEMIFDAVNVGMLLLDESGSVKRVNNVVSQLLDKDPSALCDVPPGNALECAHALLDPQGCGYSGHCEDCCIRTAFESVLRTGVPIHDVETKATLNIGGKEVDLWLDISADPILLNGKKHVVLAINNITDRKEAERALDQTRDYLEKLLDYAHAPIICWDAQFRITRFNHAFERLTNYSAREVLGRDLSILFPKDSKEESFSKITRTSVGEHWEGVEIPILRKDGDTRIALWNSANIYADDGTTLLATIAQGQDITARKKIAEALREANSELERRVAQRTEELLKAQSELTEKKRLSDIGTLAATVAHELRNPLAAIKMATYNIKKKADNPLLDKHLANIDTKVSESAQIIDNLLFYSRLKIPRLEHAQIYGILNECIISSVERYAKSGISLGKDIEPLRGIVSEIDILQIKEVFNNILNNAFEAFSGAAGGINVDSIVADNSMIIRIRDNGVGIDKEHLDKVFNPFFTTKAKGTGLGLAVCQQVMRLHNGTIAIESEPGKGTAVTLTLPIRQNINV